MNDFLTEKIKKTGVVGKSLKVGFFVGFCILLSLDAIGASGKYDCEDAGEWQ